MKIQSKYHIDIFALIGKMKIFIWIFLILIFTAIIGCSVRVKQVYYNEMLKPPLLEISDNDLHITTENSAQNSALLIYKIQATTKPVEKEIYLIGFQAPMRKFRNKFQITLDKEVITKINDYTIYWKDPDNSKHEIKISNTP